jgi:hypothetical protein
MELTRNAERCYFGTAPTMGMVNIAYGDGTAQEWLSFQIADLSQFSGAREKISGRQLEQLDNIIAQDYSYLKISEVMLFFRQFKKGRFGKFYGSVDPLAITNALIDFVKERNEVYFKHESQINDEKRLAESQKPHTTYEQYLKSKQNEAAKKRKSKSNHRDR